MHFYILDVFGNSKYTGNQLAVFTDTDDLPSVDMQRIAREINFSETTFITSRQQLQGGYPVRIFTPGREVDFAGHPTLGTAYIIRKFIDPSHSDITKLNLAVGQIPVTFEGDLIWMRQNPPIFGDILPARLIADLLNLHVGDLDERFPVMEVSTGLPFTIVPLKNQEALKRAGINHDLFPDFIKKAWAKGIMVFCPEGYNSKQDLSSRVFVDYYGIPEDPATGSATGCLAAYLINTGMFGKSRLQMTIGQGYEIGRPSELMIRAELNDQEYEIIVGGKVFVIAEGEWGI